MFIKLFRAATGSRDLKPEDFQTPATVKQVEVVGKGVEVLAWDMYRMVGPLEEVVFDIFHILLKRNPEKQWSGRTGWITPYRIYSELMRGTKDGYKGGIKPIIRAFNKLKEADRI